MTHAAVNGSSNNKTSLLEERGEHRLPPASYAAAIQENWGNIASQDALNPQVAGKRKLDAPVKYEGQGEKEDSPRSPVRKAQHQRRGSLRANGIMKDEGSRALVGTQNDRDHEMLTTVKPDAFFEMALGQHKGDGRERSEQNRRQLVSGRRAGAGWETSGIRWAPLNIPIKRRLQTLVVLVHTLSIPILLTSFFLLCSIPLFWPIVFPYTIYVLFSKAGTSGRLSRRSQFARSSRVWSLFASYFPAQLHRSAPLVNTRKYIFGYHPHGIISHSAFAAFGTEALGFSQLFPGITNTLLTLDSNFRIPLYREYILAMGLASVSRESCENILNRGGHNGEGMGRAITIVVGGARESLDGQPGSMRLVLKRRKGFVKLAVRTGADLVPVLSFGENDLYDQVSPDTHPLIHQFQMGVKKVLGFTVPLFHARGVFNYDVGLMAYRRPLNVVVGRPIKVQRQERPEEAYVDELHGAYIRELKRIWEEWKDVFAVDRVSELEIVE